MKTEGFIENRILWRASKSNLPNRNVFIYEDMPDSKRSKYAHIIDKVDSGKIILLFVGKSRVWTAVGTKMIVGFDGEKVNSIRIDDIKHIDSKRMKELPDEPTGWTRIPRKLNEKAVILTDKGGVESTFLTRKGKNLFSLCSMLLMLKRLD
ncbi:MAG: hypothetical protein P8P74_09050 [Crocinitomicaceae bacterium]|nr:hypothetical protein [Crocinitomicaceae bacterium]